MKWIYPFYLFLAYLGFYWGISHPETKIDKLYQWGDNKQSLTNGSWFTNLNLARDDQGFLQRAVVARIGLGANTKEEAIYLNARVDAEGKPLHSGNKYEIIFPTNLPVESFWSLTIYGEDHYLVDNPFDKYTIASYQGLSTSTDGNIHILLSTSPPENTNNWLPLPNKEEPFTLTLRCYQPSAEMLEDIQSIPLPEIRQIP